MKTGIEAWSFDGKTGIQDDVCGVKRIKYMRVVSVYKSAIGAKVTVNSRSRISM